MATGTIHIHNRHVMMEVTSENVEGRGDENNPMINVSVKFEHPGGQNEKLQLLGAGAKLYAAQKSIPIGETWQPNSWFLRENEPFHLHFSIPVTAEIIEKIEQSRKGNIHFLLECTLQLGKYEPISLAGQGNQRIEKHFMTEAITGSNGQVKFEIEQSQWVNKILYSWKLNQTSLIELPSYTNVVPDEYQESRDELDEALRYFNNGDYDKAVGHCRAALEPFKRKMNELKAHIKSTHDFEWMNDISEATEKWLDTMLRQTFHFAAKTHHAPSIGHFDRADAQIITMVTTAIIGYVGKTGFKMD